MLDRDESPCRRWLPLPRAALRNVQRSAERIGAMVNDLLDAARIEAARLSLRPEQVSLPDAARALVERLRPALGSRTIDLRIIGSPPAVDADPTRLDQILTNLIENAAKHAGEDSPISIRVSPAGQGVELVVQDRGPGIPSADLPLLFDRFYQAKRAREDKKGGFGLGLYIAKGLVEAHGGRIAVESELGSGTTFTVWLPRPSMGSANRVRSKSPLARRNR